MQICTHAHTHADTHADTQDTNELISEKWYRERRQQSPSELAGLRDAVIFDDEMCSRLWS